LVFLHTLTNTGRASADATYLPVESVYIELSKHLVVGHTNPSNETVSPNALYSYI